MEVFPRDRNSFFASQELCSACHRCLFWMRQRRPSIRRTEIHIQHAFAKMMQGRTSFIVAHRLSTIQEADVILVMKDGHIIEQGNHEQLLQQNGFYATLYNSQFAG